ncbi:MAG: argininosuccinate lyase [Acidobacteria bacterium]|nr:argininosuccinate lyase [Acidobacteriota bacterium]
MAKASSDQPKPAYKLWGGRFEKATGEQLEAFSRSIQFDYRFALADIRGTKAYVRALQRARILTRDEMTRAAQALDSLADEVAGSGPKFFEGAPEEDVHSFVLGKLRERIGSLADKLHTGRSRNEQVAVDFRMWLKDDAIIPAQKALRELMAALVAAAERNMSVVLPGYTHMRRAQPVLWAHYLLAYFEMFRRDYERLERCFEAADVMPLGSGALAGSGLRPERPMDREAVAKELGFSRVSRNSMDAVSERDFALEFLFAASLCFLHMSRLAEDWIIYSSEEFAFLEMGDEVSTGSSLMPQKKNPDALELIRGKTGRVLGHLMALATTVKGLPLTYNRDLQEDKEPVFDAAEQLIPALKLATQVVSSVSVNADAMKNAASDGWLCATDLAEFLAAKGMAFHEAHQIVGKLVLESLRAGRQPQDCTLNDLKHYSPLFDKNALPLLTPEAGVARRTVKGGTSPASVREALKEAHRWLNAI